MFQFFRRKDKLVRVFLGGLLVMVCVMLVVTLIPGLTGTGSTPDELVLAKVGGEEITSTAVSRQLQLMSRGSRLPASLLPLYAPQIVNQMVMEKAVLLEARRLGLSVSEEELAGQLRSNPTFFQNGQFIGKEQYQNFVETRFGMSIPQFEAKFRESLVADKLRRLVTAGVSISDEEVKREFHRRNDKIKIEYALLKTGDVKASLQLTDAEIAGFFQKNKGRYTMPERRKFKLIFIDTARLKESVPVSDDDVRRYYNQNRDRFRVEDRAKVRHILFKTVGKSAEETEAVRKKAEEVLKRLRAAEDFAKLAKENSEDAATTPKGGDLGWIVRGQTVPEFEKAAFSQQPGAISDVVKTVYGFHILKVEERERAHQQSLDEVRIQIVPQVKQEKAQREAEELSHKAENALKKNPGNIQAVAGQLGLQVIDTDLLKRGDGLPQAGTSQAVEDALFAASLKANELTQPAPVAGGLVVAQLAQISPAHPAELNEVRAQVVTDLSNEKAGQVAVSRMKELAEQARGQGDLKKPAAAQKLTVATSEPITRDGSIKDLGAAGSLGEAAFSMNPGDIGGPVAATDGQVVFRVLERLPASEQEFAQARGSIQRQLLDSKRGAYFQLFAESLKERLEKDGTLKVNLAAIQRLSSSLQP